MRVMQQYFSSVYKPIIRNLEAFEHGNQDTLRLPGTIIQELDTLKSKYKKGDR